MGWWGAPLDLEAHHLLLLAAASSLPLEQSSSLTSGSAWPGWWWTADLASSHLGEQISDRASQDSGPSPQKARLSEDAA